MDRRRVRQEVAHRVAEQVEHGACLGDHGRERADGDLDAQHVGEQLRHSVIGKVLVDGEVAGERPHPVAVAGGSRRLSRRGGLHLATAPAPEPQQVVLSRIGSDLREIEDLADLIVDHLGIAQLRPAVRARRRRVDKHLVGIGHLREVLALRAGLLSLATRLCPALCTVSG